MGSIIARGSKQQSARKMEHFSRMINLYEDLLFGLTLFSDCMAAYYRGQVNIFTLNDNTFRNIKLKMAAVIDSARSLEGLGGQIFILDSSLD